MERRLAAILFTDVVGYTGLMGRDESAGRRVRARHEALVRAQVTRYRGQWIEEKGDESLSVFPSALQAVNCALSIQAELVADAELQLRIGIHLGDVTLEDDGRVYGDGVNVASRIRSLAEPGGVAVSGPVYDSIKNQVDLAASPQGEQRLKGVAAPVAVHASVLDGDVAQVDTDAEPRFGICLELGLDCERAVHGLERAREHRQRLVALLLDPLAAVAGDLRAHQGLVAGAHAATGGLVAAHQGGVVDHVGEQDGGEPSLHRGLLDVYPPTSVLWRGPARERCPARWAAAIGLPRLIRARF